jgi:hypothetical protein
MPGETPAGLTHMNGRSDFPRLPWRVGTIRAESGSLPCSRTLRSGVEEHMNGIIYLVGLIVVVLAILSFLGLR